MEAILEAVEFEQIPTLRGRRMHGRTLIFWGFFTVANVNLSTKGIKGVFLFFSFFFWIAINSTVDYLEDDIDVKRIIHNSRVSWNRWTCESIHSKGRRSGEFRFVPSQFDSLHTLALEHSICVPPPSRRAEKRHSSIQRQACLQSHLQLLPRQRLRCQ